MSIEIPRRYRLSAELEKPLYEKVVVIPPGMRKRVISGLIQTFLDASPETATGEVDLEYAMSVSQGKFELIRKDTRSTGNES
tara:strand:- start:183 stop:428 length:246 start_codon:yes stop_codon:yes gene_type:complete